MKLTEAIRLRILDLCNQQNMSADMLVKKADASPNTVALIISGRENLIMLEDMKSICDVFGITMEAFFRCDLFADF